MTHASPARLYDQISQLLATGQAPLARPLAQQLAAADPKNPSAHALAAHVFYTSGQPQQAEYFASNAAALAPKDVGLLLQHANLLSVVGKTDKTIAVLNKALALDPANISVKIALASALQECNRCFEALNHAKDALKLAREVTPSPDTSPDTLLAAPLIGAATTLAACLLNIGDAAEAFAVLSEFAADYPGDAHLASGLALISNYVPGISRQEQERLHERYGQIISSAPPFITPVADGRAIPRIGIVSPDLRAHSVAAFVEPFLKHYDRSSAQVYVYQTNAIADATTARLKPLATLWRVMDNISDQGLTQAIRADALDVLVELSGHTHAHCLPALSPRAAPVQVTYLGYPNITGVPSIDFRLVDSITDPPQVDAQRVNSSERFLRLDPCFLCYQPPAKAPPVSPPPSLVNSYITFGSFNNAQKLNLYIIKLWASILNRAPTARLLLKGVALSEPALQLYISSRFAAAGVSKSQLIILPRAATTAEHLAQYAKVDIALDTAPYCGTTTTCEALYMGVPVVTLCPPTPHGTHASRVGASLLSAIGATDLIAHSPEDYVTLALRLAKSNLASRRESLRATLLASPLCDGPAFATRLVQTLTQLAKPNPNSNL